ncbi:hypothetical protein ACF2JD_07515 [Aeromonas sp. A-5]|uniref:hypothetical protein n=1 Tax=Aeromonas ichthyocola TaxID=3367746 RepID=UPI0038F0F1A8
MTCHDYIAQHAIELAQAVRHFLAREMPYRQLEDLSWQLLSRWQALPAIPIDKVPATEQEGVFWHLLHSLHLWDEHQLSLLALAICHQPAKMTHFSDKMSSGS